MSWDWLRPRVVMVARWDARDGIARYAEQLMAAQPREYLRVGIVEAPGDYHRDFHRPPYALWLLRDARWRDDVVVHWHPHYYLRGGRLNRAAARASWALLARLRRVTVVAHEGDPPPLRRVIYLSERVRAGRRGMVVDHGAHFTTTVRATHAEARERLGLPADRTLLVMIGFLSPSDPDKGYDRAIAAARAVPDVELHIVGSPIREAPEVDALLAQLRAAAREPRIHLHEGFVDDEAFDLWLRAADAVLTPYRTGSSSGVLARARLLGTPFVTSDAGGLAEQAGPDDFVVRDDAELIAAVRALAARGTGARRRR